jgi:hypothetical protein
LLERGIGVAVVDVPEINLVANYLPGVEGARERGGVAGELGRRTPAFQIRSSSRLTSATCVLRERIVKESTDGSAGGETIISVTPAGPSRTSPTIHCRPNNARSSCLATTRTDFE